MLSRRIFFVFAAVLASGSVAVMPGCDWLHGSNAGLRQSPFVSNLSIRPSLVLCEKEFLVSFYYEDAQGDIALARVTLQRTGGTEVREETPPWPDTISGMSGTVVFPFKFACDSARGIWSIKVQAEDDLGHTSNSISGEITLN